MNTNAKSLTIPTFPRPFNGLWLSLASVLRWINRGYNDYNIRLEMGELSEQEARAEIFGDIANAECNRLAGVFWSGG